MVPTERMINLLEWLEKEQQKILDELDFQLDKNYNDFVTERKKILEAFRDNQINPRN